MGLTACVPGVSTTSTTVATTSRAWDQSASYPYDDVRNALADANAIGADQMHVDNFGTSDADEAARYVSFLNHAGDANRAAHPVAQQNVQMFELGNEISWNLVRGHDTYAPTETAYATRARQFARAMRAASDVPIQIGAVASTNANWFGSGWSGGATSVKNILTTMGPDVDFLIYHGYPSWPMAKSGDLLTLMAQHWGDQIVATSASGVPTTHVVGASASVELPRLAFSAATSGATTWLMVLNRTNEGDVAADVDPGFTPSGVTAYTLAGDNGWDSADAAVTTEAGAALAGHVFPRASVTIFEIAR
jgi:hypothetical protein